MERVALLRRLPLASRPSKVKTFVEPVSGSWIVQLVIEVQVSGYGMPLIVIVRAAMGARPLKLTSVLGLVKLLPPLAVISKGALTCESSQRMYCWRVAMKFLMLLGSTASMSLAW